jgi:hypothetical protein
MPWLILGACTPKPSPSVETRACYVGVLDSETAMLLRSQDHRYDVKSGDLIQTRECAMQSAEDVKNGIYLLTR